MSSPPLSQRTVNAARAPRARGLRALVLAVTAAALLSVAPRPARAQGRPTFDVDATYRVQLDDSPRRGPADAPITIVELSDFACRYCNRAQAAIEQLEQLYPGKIRRVYRQTPLDPEDGTLAAEAALAAHSQGQFWPMHDRLFAVHGQVDRASVDAIAAELGLDLARFRADLDSRRQRAIVARDSTAAVSLGVFSTPWFFINGRPVRGAQPLSVLRRVVDEELARAASMVASGVPPADLYDTLMANAQPHGTAGGPEEVYDRPRLDADQIYRIGLGDPGTRIGADAAPVTVVVFSDFECPFCVRIAPTLARLRREHPDDVRMVYRHLLMQSHPHAQLAAEASMAAAAQGKFWQYHDLLLADPGHLERSELESRAAALGLDLAAFRAALDDRRYHDAVAADAAAAASVGVTGTPTVFVNGTPLEGAVPYDALDSLVTAKRNEARALVGHDVDPRDVYGLIMQTATHTEAGDPSRVPEVASVELALTQDDYTASVTAACRARDTARAKKLADRLDRKHRLLVRSTCAVHGVDLPAT
jgi:protein-disulfide isomerase